MRNEKALSLSKVILTMLIAKNNRKERAMNRKNIARKRALVKDCLIFGIDIGKLWHYCVALLPSGEFTKPFKFFNNSHGFSKLFAFITSVQQKTGISNMVVGLESTGHYWECLAYFLDRHGISVVQVNPAHTKKAKELLDNSPLKSDPKDSIVIADLVAQGKFLSFILPKGIYAELRQLTKARQRLNKELSAAVNTLHSIVDLIFPELTTIFSSLTSKTVRFLLHNYPRPSDILTKSLETLTILIRRESRGRVGEDKIRVLYEAAQTSVGIKDGIEQIPMVLAPYLNRIDDLLHHKKELETLIITLAKKVPETEYLLSLKGFGLITIATILAEVGGFSGYRNAQGLIKLAGLNLYRVSSGKYQGTVKITKRGRSILRWILYFAALRQVRQGMPLYDFYCRLLQRGIPKTKVLIAVACKLLRIAFALVRDRKHYGVGCESTLVAA
jgi:transposase